MQQSEALEGIFHGIESGIKYEESHQISKAIEEYEQVLRQMQRLIETTPSFTSSVSSTSPTHQPQQLQQDGPESHLQLLQEQFIHYSNKVSELKELLLVQEELDELDLEQDELGGVEGGELETESKTETSSLYQQSLAALPTLPSSKPQQVLIQDLNTMVSTNHSLVNAPPDEESLLLGAAKESLAQAEKLDSQLSTSSEALATQQQVDHLIEKYLQAAQSYIEALRYVPMESRWSMEQTVHRLLSRVEILKSGSFASHTTTASPLPFLSNGSPHGHAVGYTADELEVLKRTSVINGKLFQPWLESDVKEKFIYETPFVDSDGFLSLSTSQKKRFYAWQRPSQIFMKQGGNSHVMIQRISPDVIVQEHVTDCSFIASLCITAAFELRERKQLITKIIFPQDHTGAPIYNPSGKYMVRLWANGLPRKVIVDDLLPVNSHGKLLCSYSTNEQELWVSIIEKAYMKLNGGYDFPGSNSGIDLYSLTGWIPEMLSLEESSNTSSTIWQRLLSAHAFGDCLITLATGSLSKEEEKLHGLASAHAYAVLNVVKTKRGLQMLQIKNPWNQKSWKGPFSCEDITNWTRELELELGYNRFEAATATQTTEDGIFWIDFPSVRHYFKGLFLNWNRSLFPFTTSLHQHWPVHVGPKNDQYNVGYNPQFTLHVPFKKNLELERRQTMKHSIWVLLSRHAIKKIQVTDEQTRQVMNEEYVAVHVYNHQGGRRVYYPSEKRLVQGSYSSSPHILTCLDVDSPTKTNESINYTIVLSQYEKRSSMDYTLSVFSTTHFVLSHTSTGPRHQMVLNDSWSCHNSGGSANFPTFMYNPQYHFQVLTRTPVLILLEAPILYAVNVLLMKQQPSNFATDRLFSYYDGIEVASTGDYRHGFTYLELDHQEILEPGNYIIIPSTYNPQSLGQYKMTIGVDNKSCIEIKSIPLEGYGMLKQVVTGKWSNSKRTAAGCFNHGRYHYNPQFLLHVPTSSSHTRYELTIRLQLHPLFPPLASSETTYYQPISADTSILPSLNLSIYQTDSSGSLWPHANPQSATASSNGGIYSGNISGVSIQRMTLARGCYYNIVPSTFEPQVSKKFHLVIYTNFACDPIIPLKP